MLIEILAVGIRLVAGNINVTYLSESGDIIQEKRMSFVENERLLGYLWRTIPYASAQ